MSSLQRQKLILDEPIKAAIAFYLLPSKLKKKFLAKNGYDLKNDISQY